MPDNGATPDGGGAVSPPTGSNDDAHTAGDITSVESAAGPVMAGLDRVKLTLTRMEHAAEVRAERFSWRLESLIIFLEETGWDIAERSYPQATARAFPERDACPTVARTPPREET
jgi:hypothetical protein